MEKANFEQFLPQQQEEEKKTDYLQRQPNLEIFQSVSKDGRYQIVKTVTTHIVPINYIKKVLTNSSQPQGRN